MNKQEKPSILSALNICNLSETIGSALDDLDEKSAAEQLLDYRQRQREER